MLILIADDQLEVRSALRLLFEQQREDCVISDAEDRESMLAEAARLFPDIIIMDAELKGLNLKNDPLNVKSLKNTITALRSSSPQVIVVALTSRPDLRKIFDECGADFLLSKADPPEALLNTIQDLCCG